MIGIRYGLVPEKRERDHWCQINISDGAETIAQSGIFYPGQVSILSELLEIQEQPVGVDGTVLTSRGAGTAVELGLALVAALV
jgi:hypothetical protein